MKILVTGGAGFIGSHLCDGLLADGHQVHIVDNLSTGQEEFIARTAVFHRADIGDPELAGLFQRERFDVMYHLAAQIDVRASVADPVADARTNVLGSLNLLQQCVASGVGRVVFASTGGAIYGDTEHRPTPEDADCRPVSPYGITKLSLEKYLHFYRVQHGLAHTVLRFGNVYGPRQNPHGEAGVVAIFCKRLLAGEPAVINGDGLQSRDYVHVSDVARACRLALAVDREELTCNVGTGVERDVVALFRILRDELAPDTPELFGPAAPGEQRTSCLDIRHTRAVLGWQPEVSFEDGLRATARWFRERQGGRG
ncbi:MAG: NAD-dependent epimerase/dehydratase family protein [Candidatus Cloacimonetes bacterium]|nr:NAD-dependent epimerase/dehydratase family protein [Candidatus Cloacimonadota bacterium]